MKAFNSDKLTVQMFSSISSSQEADWHVGRCGSGEGAESSMIETPGTQTWPDFLKL